jgi:hypothetical protein
MTPRQRHHDVAVVILLFSSLVMPVGPTLLRQAGGAVAMRRAPVRASARSMRPLSPAAISRAPPRTPALPTLVASGSHPHPHRRAPEEEKKGGKRRRRCQSREQRRHRHGSRRLPVESLDAEKPHTSTPCLLRFLYECRLHPLHRVKLFFTAAFTFWYRRP